MLPGGVYGNGGTINLYLTASYSVSAAVPFGRIRKGTLNIKGGTFKSSGTNGAFYIDAGATGSPVINMTGGLAYVENAYANATYPVFRLECGTFNLSGGLIGKIGQSGSGDARIASYRSVDSRVNIGSRCALLLC